MEKIAFTLKSSSFYQIPMQIIESWPTFIHSSPHIELIWRCAGIRVRLEGFVAYGHGKSFKIVGIRSSQTFWTLLCKYQRSLIRWLRWKFISYKGRHSRDKFQGITRRKFTINGTRSAGAPSGVKYRQVMEVRRVKSNYNKGKPFSKLPSSSILFSVIKIFVEESFPSPFPRALQNLLQNPPRRSTI